MIQAEGTLRVDEAQWLIYQEPSVVAAVRAMEILSMLLAGPALAKHSDLPMRAMGNMMMRLGEYRLQYMLGSDSSYEERVAGQHVSTILGSIIGLGDASKAKDELHAALFWLDSHVKKLNIGWPSELIKGYR